MRQQYGMEPRIANPSITNCAVEEQELDVETMGDCTDSTLLSRRPFLFAAAEKKNEPQPVSLLIQKRRLYEILRRNLKFTILQCEHQIAHLL